MIHGGPESGTCPVCGGLTVDGVCGADNTRYVSADEFFSANARNSGAVQVFVLTWQGESSVHITLPTPWTNHHLAPGCPPWNQVIEYLNKHHAAIAFGVDKTTYGTMHSFPLAEPPAHCSDCLLNYRDYCGKSCPWPTPMVGDNPCPFPVDCEMCEDPCPQFCDYAQGRPVSPFVEYTSEPPVEEFCGTCNIGRQGHCKLEELCHCRKEE